MKTIKSYNFRGKLTRRPRRVVPVDDVGRRTDVIGGTEISLGLVTYK